MKNIDYKTVNKYILGAFLFILSWFFSLSMADTISDQFVCTWWVCSMKPAALKWLCTNAIIWTSSYFMECTPAVNYNPSSSVLAANSVTTFNSIGDFFDCSSGTCILKKESLNWICAVNYTLYFDAWWNVTCIPLTSLTSAPCSASTKNVNWHTYNLPLFNAQVQSSSIVNANNWSFTYYQNFWCDNWVVSTIWSESIDGTKTTCNSWYSVSADWLSCIPLNCSFNWNVVNNWSSVTAYSLLNATYPTLCSSQSRVCTNWTLWWTYTYDSCTQSYVYSWTTWAYWSCSATCWWGTQTRTVVCQRNDWQIVADTNCTWAKPATSQSCNTQVCVINYYTNTDYTLACPASVAIWY
ncbi:MAG: thrombospondin, type 1 repeat protein, partial [uncultured bacterium (gcode 4)]